jgi:hypothetical protein
MFVDLQRLPKVWPNWSDPSTLRLSGAEREHHDASQTACALAAAFFSFLAARVMGVNGC